MGQPHYLLGLRRLFRLGSGERYVQRDGEVEAAIVQRQQLDLGGDGSTGEGRTEFVGNVDQRIGEAGGITGGQQLLRVIALAVATEGGRQCQCQLQAVVQGVNLTVAAWAMA